MRKVAAMPAPIQGPHTHIRTQTKYKYILGVHLDEYVITLAQM